jgi:hypothetical protein
MKPRSQAKLALAFSSPFFFPYQEESWNQQQYLRVNYFTLLKLCQPFVPGNFAFGNYYYLPINILMSIILMGGGD